jgi:hypothetical protein
LRCENYEPADPLKILTKRLAGSRASHGRRSKVAICSWLFFSKAAPPEIESAAASVQGK